MIRAESPDEFIVIRTYRYRHEAEVDRSMLQANKVDAIISADDLGGVHPSFGATNGVKLLVRRRDEPGAMRFLIV
jgi:hypothetical protein